MLASLFLQKRIFFFWRDNDEALPVVMKGARISAGSPSPVLFIISSEKMPETKLQQLPESNCARKTCNQSGTIGMSLHLTVCQLS
jgi:hypothetical protein